MGATSCGEELARGGRRRIAPGERRETRRASEWSRRGAARRWSGSGRPDPESRFGRRCCRLAGSRSNACRGRDACPSPEPHWSGKPGLRRLGRRARRAERAGPRSRKRPLPATPRLYGVLPRFEGNRLRGLLAHITEPQVPLEKAVNGCKDREGSGDLPDALGR